MGSGGRARDQRRDRDVAREAGAAAGKALKKIVAAGRAAGARSACTDDNDATPPARRGLSLGLWAAGVDDLSLRAATRLDEIAALGATDVALVVGWRQTDIHATELAPGPDTPSDADVRAIAHAARERGLAVVMFPIVLLDKTAMGEWRGTLAPDDVDAWWSAYEAFVLHYAAIASDAGASALVVGSELGSTEAWRDRWYHLLGRVERAYTGALWYSANWDHYEKVSFWSRLDAIGVTGYFELTKDADAREADLARAWTAPRDALLAFAAKAGKPLVLTEVGYPSRDGSTTQPWDYTSTAAIDLEEQRRAFAALATAWADTELGGVLVWEWGEGGGAKDGGYTPRGKPAACELARWFTHQY